MNPGSLIEEVCIDHYTRLSMVLGNTTWGPKGKAPKINEGSFQNKSYEVNFKKISFFILGQKRSPPWKGKRRRNELHFYSFETLHPAICLKQEHGF